jgi:hypothetical protein
MSDVIKMLADGLSGNLDMLKTHLADFSDADMMVRPVENANHAAWQLGHLLTFEAMVCGMFNAKAAPKLPDNAEKLYGKEGSKNDDKGAFIRKDEALTLLSKARGGLVEWARGLSDADLQKAGPEQFKGWVNTLGELITAIRDHTTMHIGQFQVIRRKLGKKVLF